MGATVRPETSLITANLGCVKSQKSLSIARCRIFLATCYFYAVWHQFTIIIVLWGRTHNTAQLMLPSSGRLSKSRVRQHNALGCRQCPI